MNLSDAVWKNAESHPDLPVIARDVFQPDVLLTTTEFRDLVARVAKGLIAFGIQPGDRVGLMSRTRFEWTLFDYAIWAVGAVTVPVYETSSTEQAQWMLSDSGAVAVIVESPQHAVTIAEVRSELPALRTVWQIDADPAAETVLVDKGQTITDEELERRRHAVKAEDLATIIYTSGTIGRPKGCELSHHNFLAGSGSAVGIFATQLDMSARIVLFLPLAHVFAREIQVCIISARAKLAFCADTKKVVEAAQAFRPTIMLAVPRVLEKLYNGAKQKAYAAGKEKIFNAAERTAIAYSQALDRTEHGGKISVLMRIKHAIFDWLVYRKIRAVLGGQCSTAISGGAPLGIHINHFFRGIGLDVFEGWGLTETTAAATANRPGEVRIGSVGRPLPGTAIKIDDDNEILVKGDIVFNGYWRNNELTAQAIDSEGWFHTGDLGTVDEDGYLSITGRKKEILVTAAGKNVAPAPLEALIGIHPLISQSMVIGDNKPFIACLVTIDDEMLQIWKTEHNKSPDLGMAELRNDPDLHTAVQSAIDSANKTVSRAEQIKVFRILSTDFTVENGLLTPSMKVKREKVAAAHADEIAAIYG